MEWHSLILVKEWMEESGEEGMGGKGRGKGESALYLYPYPNPSLRPGLIYTPLYSRQTCSTRPAVALCPVLLPLYPHSHSRSHSHPHRPRYL